jgi:mannosyl-oligosaccharide glucosidase
MILRSPPCVGILAVLAALFFLTSSVSAAQSLTSIERASNQSLLWGPYRPNLYFGVRPRIPNSLSMGLLWAKVEDYVSVQDNFRYTCEQHEGMAGYGWEKYDPRHGGVQTVHDAGNGIDITTSFFKDTSARAGEKGGNWGVRIKGTPREGMSEDLKTTVVFNVNLEGVSGVYNNLEVQEEDGYDGGDVVLKGETTGLGPFKLTVKGDAEGSGNRHPVHAHPSGAHKSLDRTFVNSKVLGAETAWQSKPLLFALLKQQIDEYIAEYTQENLPPPWQLYTLEPSSGAGNVHLSLTSSSPLVRRARTSHRPI